MDKAGEDHPARLPIRAQVLGGLEQVFELREVGVRIGVVDKLVKVFGSLPDPHPPAVETEELLALRQGKFVGLKRVVQPVELAHGRPRVGLVIAKFLLLSSPGRCQPTGVSGCRLGLGVSLFEEILDFVERIERLIGSEMTELMHSRSCPLGGWGKQFFRITQARVA